MVNSFVRFTTLVVLSLFVVSCGRGPSNILSGVKVETSTVADDIWMSFAADLNLGAMNFASVSLPVLHPRGQTPIGHLELVSGLTGSNQIKISINISELADVEASRALLPNGNMIPLIANNQTIEVNIGKGARIYLTLDQNVTAIGVAVPIQAFDNIGSRLPGLNIFPMVTSGEIVGTAGVFTGANSGENGIAVVADVSKVVNLGQLLPSHVPMVALQEEEDHDLIRLDYDSHSVSTSKKSKFDSLIYQLNRKKTILRM